MSLLMGVVEEVASKGSKDEVCGKYFLNEPTALQEICEKLNFTSAGFLDRRSFGVDKVGKCYNGKSLDKEGIKVLINCTEGINSRRISCKGDKAIFSLNGRKCYQ